MAEFLDANVNQNNGKSKKKKILLAIIIAVSVLLIFALLITVLGAYFFISYTTAPDGVSFFGYNVLSIQTDSMSDTLNHGDLIFVDEADPNELRQGDIITYWTIINGERVLNTHRIVDIYDGGGFLIFETKGDANSSADPLTVRESEIVGKYKFKIPALGKLLDNISAMLGLIFN